MLELAAVGLFLAPRTQAEFSGRDALYEGIAAHTDICHGHLIMGAAKWY
jgi:hypothetical protein